LNHFSFLKVKKHKALIYKVQTNEQWEEKLNAFLEFNDREVLTNTGSISHKVAKELAFKEYEKFNQHRLEMPKENGFDIYLEEHEWTHKKR
jgi:hypothetical protein